MDGRQDFYDSDTDGAESEFSRRMRVAREVDEEMAREKEEMKMKMKEAERARWTRERERERARWAALRELHKGWDVDARSNGSNEMYSGGWEKIQGLGLHEKESSSRAWGPRPKPKMELRQRAPTQNTHPRTDKDHVDWKLEMYPGEHRSGHGEQDHRGPAARPERWVEVREKDRGDVEVVMVRRRRRGK